MNKLVLLLAALTVTACKPDMSSVEAKLDALNKKIDDKCGGSGPARPAAAQRAPRPEPDRAKT